MSESLKLLTQPSNRYAQAGRTSRLKLLIDLTPLSGFSAVAVPLNLTVLIDRSTSMFGDPLDRVREAVVQLGRRLSNRDVLALVAFDAQVSILREAKPGVDIAELEGQVDGLEAKGATNIHGALEAGRLQAKRHQSTTGINRLLLISDGEATAGITEDEAILELADQIAQSGVSISTLGLGEEYDEWLLSEIAHRTGGNHAFIERAAQVPEILASEFDQIKRVVAREVTLRIRLDEGVRITWVNERQKVRFDKNELVLRTSDVLAGSPSSTVLEFETEGHGEGIHPCLTVHVDYQPMDGVSSRVSSESQVELEFVSQTSKIRDGIDRAVLRRWEELKALESLGNILRRVKDKEIDTKTAVLELDKRTQMLIKKKSLGVARTLADFSRTMVEEGGISPTLSKKTIVDMTAIERGVSTKTMVEEDPS